MKIIRSVFVVLFLSISAVFGLAAEIGSPEIGYRAGLDDAGQAKVSKVLEYLNKDLKFIEGNFINQFSYQRYGGSSKKAAGLIVLLKDAGVWELKVSFRDFGEQETALTLNQESGKRIQLTINSGRNDFLLKDFAPMLTPLSVPGPDQKKAEIEGTRLD